MTGACVKSSRAGRPAKAKERAKRGDQGKFSAALATCWAELPAEAQEGLKKAGCLPQKGIFGPKN